MNLNWVAILFSVILTIILIYLIFSQVKEHHAQTDPMLDHLKRVVTPVHPVMSTLKLYRGDKSYTINKEKVYLCLKDKKGEYYPLNMLVHVLLHEVAHVLNTHDVGHTEKFHEIFDELLEKATELGAFNPSIPILDNYCS